MFYYAKDANINFNNEESQIKALKSEFKLIKKYFEKFDELSNSERRELISYLMDIEYDTGDICLITNSIVKNDHDMIMNLPTRMEYASKKSDEKHEYVYNEVNYLVTTKESFNLEDKRYSYDELMNMYYTRMICPIYEYTKELWRLSPDREQYKKMTTLEDIGIKVEPLPEFELYDIKFDESALNYQDLLFTDSNIIRPGLDLRAEIYLYKLAEKIMNEAHHEDEKKFSKTLEKYRKSRV